MIKINYIPTEYLFTCNLPSEVDITTDAASVNITVECDSNAVFNTTLYPFANKATLYDIRTIIENYILEHHRVYTDFIIFVESKEENTHTSKSNVIYSRYNIDDVAASFYIQSSFLTTLSSYAIPRTGQQYLSYILFPKKNVNCYTECLVQRKGEKTPEIITIKEEECLGADKITLKALYVKPQQLLERMNVKGKLLSFTVHRGNLAKTFYVIDSIPNLTLLLRNEFNCPEYFSLTCVTKRKLDLDRSTATSQGITTFYDDNSSYEYEVESSMLTYEEANRLSILLLSHDIEIIEGEDNNVPIIITDLSSEISDADNATNSVKFKYKYAKNRFPVSLCYPSNIFSESFCRTFD